MKYNCEHCDYNTNNKSKYERHNTSKIHQIKIGALQKNTCQYIYKIGDRSGNACEKLCRGNFCKIHKPARLEKDSLKNKLETTKLYKKEWVEKNRDSVLAKKKEYYEKNKDILNENNKARRQKPEIKQAKRLKYADQHKNDLDFIIKEKIRSLKKCDNKRNREWTKEEYISLTWAKELLEELENKCIYCNKLMKFNYFDPYDPEQFSFDRTDNNIAHHRSNCVISCLMCNLKKCNIGRNKNE